MAGVPGERKGNTDALRAFYHVGVGNDVATGVDDDAGAEGLLADDERGLLAILFVDRAISGDEDLDHGGRNLGGESLEGITELCQTVGRFGLLFVSGFRESWSARF
jgi:hypothetical protein